MGTTSPAATQPRSQERSQKPAGAKGEAVRGSTAEGPAYLQRPGVAGILRRGKILDGGRRHLVRWLALTLPGAEHTELRDSAIIAIGEQLGNAEQHGAGPVLFEYTSRQAVVSVLHYHSQVFNWKRWMEHTPNSWDVSGRGIQIMRMLGELTYSWDGPLLTVTWKLRTPG